MILKDKDGEKGNTTAYSGGERAVNSFSRFGKKKKIMNDKKSKRSGKKKDGNGEE